MSNTPSRNSKFPALTPSRYSLAPAAAPPRCNFEEILWEKFKKLPGFFELANQLAPSGPLPTELQQTLKADDRIKLSPDYVERMSAMSAVIEKYQQKGMSSQLAINGMRRNYVFLPASFPSSNKTPPIAIRSVYDPIEIDTTASDYFPPVGDWPTLEEMETLASEEWSKIKEGNSIEAEGQD
jgi:hypothetical protein